MTRIRRARREDATDVAAFTRDTWPDRRGDYVADVFEDWVATDGPRQRTFVAADGDRAVGLVQFVRLSEHEAWGQGIRVHPDYRGRGVGDDLAEAGFAWARERGAAVTRSMVFSWNAAGLGQARAAGFAPATEFRWLRPDPDPAAAPAAEVTRDPGAAWSYWTRSAARDHLRGLALAREESWALRELTKADLERAADEAALFVLRDGGTRGFTCRTRTCERSGEDGDAETWAEYAVGAWDPGDADACGDLLAAVARDAAAVGADRARVLAPETVAFVSDAAAGRTAIADEPDFVMAADLTAEAE